MIASTANDVGNPIDTRPPKGGCCLVTEDDPCPDQKGDKKMSVLRPYSSPRVRLALVAASILLIAAVVAAPEVSIARAAVKQFKASMNPTTAVGQVSGSWTETVQNCGTATAAPCTAASTIGLGTIQISVPSEFRPITSVTASSPQNRNWTVSYDAGSGTIQAYATTGSDKLQPGEVLNITFSATPSTCATGTKTFTTSAWGSTPTPGTDAFVIQPPQPTITITGCQLHSGDSITGPNGTTVTGNNFDGTVAVNFGGTLTCDNAQWSSYHLPDVINIDPSGVTSSTVKTFTFTFDAGTADSSWYLICYATDPSATTGSVLRPCFNTADGTTRDPPCVSEQFRTLPSTNPDKIVISIRVPSADPKVH
jgi:hypothetical protein